MKKITIITMQLKKFGGIERFVATLSNILTDDYKVEIISNYGVDGETTAFGIDPRVKIKYLTPILPKEISLKNILKNFQLYRLPGEFIRRFNIKRDQRIAFKKALSELETDFIITERSTYNFWVQKYYHGDAKLIATDHNFHQYQKDYINSLVSSLKSFDYLVVATDELQKFYSDKIGNTKCVKIINPLDEIPTEKSTLKAKNILASGRFYPEKDFLTLIDVMKKVSKLDPSIKLYLLGNGPQEKQIKDKIKQYQLNNVEMPGFVDQEEMKKYYYNSSLFVMTSITEAFGLVITEAMSYGLPVIAFDRASGARSQIDKDTGILIEDANIDKMAKKIVELVNNKKQLMIYQKNINQKIQTYSSEATLVEWKKIL